MGIPPINRAEVKRLATQIAHADNKKKVAEELLANPNLDPEFVRAVRKVAKRIIREESGQPTLHHIKDWQFAMAIRNIQSRIEKPSEASLEEANSALERELGEISPDDYLDMCNMAQSLLLMYEYALEPEVKEKIGTKKYFYDELKRRHDGISYLNLETDAIATKSALAILRLTENEEITPYSLSLSDMELNNTINVLTKLTYSQKRDLISAYFMNPGTSGGSLYPLMKSLFAIANNLDKEIKIEQIEDTSILIPVAKSSEEESHIGQDDLPLDVYRYVVNGELFEEEIDFGGDLKPQKEPEDFASKQEKLFKELSIEINNINNFLGELLYTQVTKFPNELEASSPIDFNLDEEDEGGGLDLIDKGNRNSFALNQYTKQYVLHREEILIQGLEEHLFDFSFDRKLELFKIVSGDEHRLRLACILQNSAETEFEALKLENLFLNEINNSSLPDSTGYRASKGVGYFSSLKGPDAVEKLVEFLDHEDHLVRYTAFNMLCDSDTTGNPGQNTLVDKIEKDIREGNPSWAFAALCKQSSSRFSTDLGNEDKYRGPFIRVLLLKDINIKDALNKLDGLEVPFTLNLGEPSPGELEPLSLFEVIEYIGIPALVDISIHSPKKTIRNNAKAILELALEKFPGCLDEFMKSHELADTLRRAAGIAHASSEMGSLEAK